MGNLTARRVETEKKPGNYADGGCLYLQVQTGKGRNIGKAAKSWVFRYARNGRVRDMGLGSVKNWTLAEARERARKQRQLLDDGIDPIEHRKAEREKSAVPTFKDAAQQYITMKQHEWKNDKHAGQWHMTLKMYAYPVIGKHPVDQVDKDHVLKILTPIWYDKTETAYRTRGRMEAILDWAKAKGYREGDNPAAWKGNLKSILPSPKLTTPKKKQPSLPYTQIKVFMADLNAMEGLSPRALEFAILTGARDDQIRQAQWSQIDDDLWTIPAGAGLKGAKGAENEQRIPLAPEVVELLAALPRFSSGLLFEGAHPDRPMSNAALLSVIKRMHKSRVDAGDKGWVDPKQGRRIVTHGFRSTLRTWAEEETGFSHNVLEKVLNHAVKDDTHAAYQRGDLLKKRRKVMEAWAKYALPSEGNVVALRG